MILIITGIALSTLYRHAVERAFDRRLDVYLRTLVADVASPEEKAATSFRSRSASRCSSCRCRAGIGRSRVSMRRSPKCALRARLWDSTLPHLAEGSSAADTEYLEGYVQGPEDQSLRLVERNIDLGDEGRYLIVVAGDASEIDEETRSFNRAIGAIFGVLTLALLVTTALQVRFGLAPSTRISQSLAAIRSGRAERLEGRISRRDCAARARDQCVARGQSGDRRARAHTRR